MTEKLGPASFKTNRLFPHTEAVLDDEHEYSDGKGEWLTLEQAIARDSFSQNTPAINEGSIRTIPKINLQDRILIRSIQRGLKDSIPVNVIISIMTFHDVQRFIYNPRWDDGAILLFDYGFTPAMITTLDWLNQRMNSGRIENAS